MRHILAKRHLPTLAHFASSNVVLAFDFDGTLAPIVTSPSRACLRERTRRLLVAVASQYPCIVISGRSRADLADRLGDVPVWHVFGNHGVEPWSEAPDYARQVRQWADYLERHLPPWPGLVVENKKYSLAIHYRRVAEKRAALKTINETVRGLRRTRAVRGKQAVNLLPQDAPHKGTALERARRLLACDCAIYVGDDETDEDAFEAASPQQLLSIRVGSMRRSAARYCLRTQSEVDSLLRRLVELRAGGRHMAG
jgi:trehalose 6-phosphate phosphatase